MPIIIINIVTWIIYNYVIFYNNKKNVYINKCPIKPMSITK